MSLWWVKREQLDDDQLRLIEDLPLEGRTLVMGPPGSGKTNVLLRRAQYVRSQGLSNVLVLTFTRALAEFLKTGCYDSSGKEIFPPQLITTIESWLRSLHRDADIYLPAKGKDLVAWKRALALGGQQILQTSRIPIYDAIFVDEAQDLMIEEIAAISEHAQSLMLAGDDRQKLYAQADGLPAVRSIVTGLVQRTLLFHYRVAPKICQMADKILVTPPGPLEATSHYNGPKPGEVVFSNAAAPKADQIRAAINILKQQIRVYADLIKSGDRIGVIVAKTDDREETFAAFEADADLCGQSQIVRAREEGEQGHDPAFDENRPIAIVTIQGSKGLEFRAAHWLFADDLAHHHRLEDYYTVVTRAKTRLDVYYSTFMPQVLARAHSETGGSIW